MKETKYQICKNCVMDTSDEEISFDENGICMRCNEFKERILPNWNYGYGHEKEIKYLIDQIKRKGKRNEYDCVLGLSGGLDSSYMLHLVTKEWGLRPYVCHIDCGWDTQVAKDNIQKITNKLNVELHTVEMDYQEMYAMQLAWFKSGLSNLDSPQNHAFIAIIDKIAVKYNISYILNGYNIPTEIIADPSSWSKEGGYTGDSSFIKDVIKKCCNRKISNYEYTNGFKHKFLLPFILGIKTIKPLNYISISRDDMMKTLIRDYDYIPYGQKHFENELTKFIEGWWLPKKYGHDMRRPQLSSLIITGQMSRFDAINELENPPIPDEEGEKMFKNIAKKNEYK